MSTHDRLLNISEVCDRLQVGRSQVFELMKSDLRTVKIGRRRLIAESEIDRYIQQLMGETK